MAPTPQPPPRAVTGRTRVAGIVGWPVEHSLSPPMHNAEYERLGLDWIYVPFAVEPDSLPEAVAGLRATGVAGFNVTIPHKQAVMACLDEVTDAALAVGAVNTVVFDENRRAVGHNTDAPGWIDDIQRDILLKGLAVCVLGAGGAGRAICAAAALAGATRVLVLNRTAETGRALAEVMQERFANMVFSAETGDGPEARAAFSGCEVVVNTTPVGMAHHPGIPLPEDWLAEGQYVYDTIYTPAETALLKAARRRGLACRNGVGMLARQGALAFGLWTGQTPDADRMEATIRRHLASAG